MRSAILREKKKREKEEKKELLRTASNSLQVSFLSQSGVQRCNHDIIEMRHNKPSFSLFIGAKDGVQFRRDVTSELWGGNSKESRGFRLFA